VIARDMWLTGFDVPVLSTMYIYKPMRGHGLMQALALCAETEKAIAIRDDSGFFQAVKAALAKNAAQ